MLIPRAWIFAWMISHLGKNLPKGVAEWLNGEPCISKIGFGNIQISGVGSVDHKCVEEGVKSVRVCARQQKPPSVRRGRVSRGHLGAEVVRVQEIPLLLQLLCGPPQGLTLKAGVPLAPPSHLYT